MKKLLKKQKKTVKEKAGFKNTFKDCLLSFWANCFNMGRATIKEFALGFFVWKILPYLLLYFVEPRAVFDENKYTELSQIGQMLGDLWGDTYASATTFQRCVMMFELIYFIASSIPAFSLIVRRLHDTNRSAWFMALALVPILGQITLLVLLLKKGQPKENRFGKPRI